MSLLDAGGNVRRLEFKAGSSSDRLVVSLPPLAAGAYMIRYKVLAADGHFTENVLRFKVPASP